MAGPRKNRRAYGYDYADLPATVEYIDLNFPQYEYRQSTESLVVGTEVIDYVYTQIRPRKEGGDWGEKWGRTRIVPGGMPEKKKLTPQQQYDAALTTAARISLQRAFARASEDNDTNEMRPQPVDNIDEARQRAVIQDYVNRIGLLLHRNGVTDGGEMLAAVSTAIGRKLDNIYRITPAEAERFIKTYRNINTKETSDGQAKESD